MLLPKSYNLTGGRHRLELAGGTIIVALTYTDATTEAEMLIAAEDAWKALLQIADAIHTTEPVTITVEAQHEQS